MIIDGNFVFRKPPIGNPAELLFNDETDPALNVSVVIDDISHYRKIIRDGLYINGFNIFSFL